MAFPEDKRKLEQVLLPLPMGLMMHPPKRAVKQRPPTSALNQLPLLIHLPGSQAALRRHPDKQTATRTDSHTQATGQTASKP